MVGLFELLLGLILKQRGCKVSYLWWDGVGLSNLSSVCQSAPDYKPLYDRFEGLCRDLGVDYYSSSQFFDESDRTLQEDFLHALPPNEASNLESWQSLEFEGIPLGQVVQPSVLRWLERQTLKDHFGKFEAEVYRGFLETSVRFAMQVSRCISSLKPDRLLTLNGTYALQAVAYHMGKARRLPVVTYELAGLFSNSVPVLNKDFAKPEWSWWRSVPLSPSEGIVWQRYLKRREKVHFPTNGRISLNGLSGFDLLCSNIRWDISLIGAHRIFDSMIDWIRKTIEWYVREKRPLLIRIHPLDHRRWENVQSKALAESIQKEFPNLPSYIRVLGPQSSISTYEILRHARRVLVYNSTIGLEAAVRGCEVIVAGAAPYAGLGFTFEPDSRDVYFKRLEVIPRKLTPVQIELANRYGFYYLLRRTIPLRLIEVEKDSEGMSPRRIPTEGSKLRPGRNVFLDFVVDQIIHGGDFTMANDLACRHAKLRY